MRFQRLPKKDNKLTNSKFLVVVQIEIWQTAHNLREHSLTVQNDIHTTQEFLAKALPQVFSPEAKNLSPIQLKTSGHISDRVSCRDLTPLNANELRSIHSLLVYVAYNNSVKREAVEAIVEKRFSVDSVERLDQKDYEDVIRFLVDLHLDEILD